MTLHDDMPLRLPPPGPERERVLANALLSALQTVPRLEAVQGRMEEALLMLMGAVEGLRQEVANLRREVPNGTRPSERPVSKHDLERLEEKMEDTGRHQIAEIRAATNPVIIVQRLIVTGVRFAVKHVVERWIVHILVALGTLAAGKALHELHWVRWW
jgi:hypothetical protein